MLAHTALPLLLLSLLPDAAEAPAASSSSTLRGGVNMPPGVDRYCCDLAKSGRASCKKCDETIAKGELRVGAVMGEGRWG